MSKTKPAEQMTAQVALRAVVEGQTLTEVEAAAVMDAIMLGDVTPAQIGALLTALRMRGETVDEVTGFARALRTHVQPVHVPDDGVPIVDTCGTGGDGAGTFNISTTAALVVAGAGVRVAKHGNRSVTSKCGSADVLEALGVAIELPGDAVAASINDAGIGFMFAPAYHPGFRHAGPSRREIGIRTVFNVLGPMTNPAGVRRQIIGVSAPGMAKIMAEALANLGSERVLVVFSPEGLDELGLGAPSQITEFDRTIGSVRTYQFGPEDAGLPRAATADMAGGSADDNAQILRAVLGGELGPQRDVVLLNAGAALYAADVAPDIAEGVALARKSIDSGAAAASLARFVATTQKLFSADMGDR